MRSSLFFYSLAIFALSLLLGQRSEVDASPVSKRKPKTVTMPLTRVPRSDVHPFVSLQQQINRADRRLARMTGRAEPTRDELAGRLQKRVNELHEAGHINKFEKGYNRIGAFGGGKSKRFYRNKPRPSTSVATANALDEVNSLAEVSSTVDKEDSGLPLGTGNKKAGDAAAAAVKGQGAAATAKGATSTAAAGNATVAAGEAPDQSEIGGLSAQQGDVQVANTPATDNSLGLNIESVDIGYTATIPIGTPPTNFLVLMDSGSADFWVGSENCQSEDGGDCGTHQFLGPQTSDSFQASSAQFEITYGTGAVAGTIIKDDIDVAGLQLEGHTFGVADFETVEFSDDTTTFDGLMGLAQSTLSNQGVLTPVEALAQSGQIDAAITFYKISRSPDNLNDGQITFGAIDETIIDPATLVELENVSPDGFWEADVDAISVDGVDLGAQGRTAILDTGTTLIIMPAADAAAVLSNVEGAQGDEQAGFTVPCDTAATIALTFGGQSFEIQPEDLATGQPVGGGQCLSGIQAGNIGGATQWLIGDVFLKNAGFATNVDTNTMNLAKFV